MSGPRPANVIGFGLLCLIGLGLAISFVGKVRLAENRVNREEARRPRSMGVDMSLPDWFRNMDRNTDARLSRAEFIGTDEQFHRFDTDKDGFLSPDEAWVADAEFRTQVPK